MKIAIFDETPDGTLTQLSKVASCSKQHFEGLNLSRLKAKDSCFDAPSNEGSSTGFIPLFQRYEI
jgi:hypothetical protein